MLPGQPAAWIMRRIGVLHEGVTHDEILPMHISEQDMVADSFTKYISKAIWKKHLYYYMNSGANYPDGKTQVQNAEASSDTHD